MAVTVPGAELHLANPVSTRLVLPWWIYCHTIVGTVSSALPGRHYHLYVRGDGSFVQRQDLRLRSAASVDMNPYSIAIVAEDMGPMFPAWSGSNVPPYTPQQVKTLVLVISWICHRFGIPKSAARTSCLNSPHGVAWHRLGIDGAFPDKWPYWGRQSGCLHTSLSTGKPCPGNARITQLVTDIIPAVSSPEGGGFLADLTDEQQKELYNWVKGLAVSGVPFYQDGKPTDARFQVQTLVARALDRRLDGIEADLDAIKAAVAPPS